MIMRWRTCGRLGILREYNKTIQLNTQKGLKEGKDKGSSLLAVAQIKNGKSLKD